MAGRSRLEDLASALDYSQRSASPHLTPSPSPSSDLTGQLGSLRGSISHSSNNSYDTALPDGWESAVDKDGRVYYVNHAEGVSTYNDPRTPLDVEYEYPETRIITLCRDPHLGFGFVAGSERPVVVRCVTEGGPSDKLLLPGDQIHKINSEDVRHAPRTRVIELVKLAHDELVLTVSQPPTISTQGKKSILLNAAKKQLRVKRDSSASRVRFSEDTIKKKRSSLSVWDGEAVSTRPTIVSGVIQVHAEVNQVRSFKFDGFTLVKDVLHALQEKLDIRCIEHFGLVIHNLKSPLSAKMAVLSPTELICNVAAQLIEGSVHCLFRIVFMPRDAYDLLRKDSVAFQYFYTQCCQDVIHERFSSDLKCDVALRLASLHMQEHAIEHHVPSQKISVKLIEREFGYGLFLNPSILRTVRLKELRKMLSHFLKLNQGLTAPGQKQVTALQAKLHYMKIVSELRSFGGKCFLATLVDRKAEVMLLVGPKCGISQVTDIKSYTLHMLADFDLIEEINVTPEASGATKLIKILLTDRNLPTLILSMMNSDSKDFLTIVSGYHQLFCGASDIIKDGEDAPLTTLTNGKAENTGNHTPPALRKHLDQNENEPDYATIEEVLNPGAANGAGAVAETQPISVSSTPVTQLTAGTTAVYVDSIRSSPLPSIPTTSELSFEAELIAPTSSIDDIINEIGSSSNGSLPPSPADDMNLSLENLTEECLQELVKLDNVIGSSPYRARGDDRPSSLSPTNAIDLSCLPPPDEITQPLMTPPIIPPPPALFDDAKAMMNNADKELSEQLQAVRALSVPDKIDGESGIDSDDSGTETFNSTDVSGNVTSNSFSSIHISPATINSIETEVISPPKVSIDIQQPASSLRSRLQQHRVKAKLESQPSPLQNLFSTPVRLEPDQDLTLKQSETSVTSTKPPDTESSGSDALIKLTNGTAGSSSSVIDERPAISSGSTATSLTSVVTVLPMMLEDSHVDVSTEEEDNDGDTDCDDVITSLDNGIAAACSSINSSELISPSAAEADSHGESSDSEPQYMNSEVETPTRPVPTSLAKTQAASAIDEALNGLSSDTESDSEVGGATASPHYSPKHVLSNTHQQNNTNEESNQCEPVSSTSNTDVKSDTTSLQERKLSAKIIILNESEKRTHVPAKSVVSAPTPQSDSVDGTPRPPPRRRRGMSATSSPATLSTLSERPPSRNSLPETSSQANDSEASKVIYRQTAESKSSPRNENSSRSVQLNSRPASSLSRSMSATSSISELSSTGSGRYSSSPRYVSPRTSNPISSDLNLLKSKRRNSKAERTRSSASVIGSPTNISCTASDVLANCVPIVQTDSPLSRSSSSLADVTVTSRESLLGEIIKNAHTTGIDPLGLNKFSDKRSSSSSIPNSLSRHNSVLSTDSSGSTRTPRPTAPPPAPPTQLSKKISRSESDLLSADDPQEAGNAIEAMLEIEYAMIDDKTPVEVQRRKATVTSHHKSPSPDPQSRRSRSRDSTIAEDSGLEKDGSFVKFSGYSGAPPASPPTNRRSRFRKKHQSMSLVPDQMVAESQQKKGIMAKILNTIKPKRRSMSLDRLHSELAAGRKIEGGSLKSPPESSSRPSILPSDGKHSKSHTFRSLGRTKFHSKPKMSMSLTDLAHPYPTNEEELTDRSQVQSRSAENLLDPKPQALNHTVEELHTSGDRINPAGVLNYTYEPHSAFTQAIDHTVKLREYFTAYCDTQWAPSLNPDPNAFTRVKEMLISDGRQFISNSKQLVAGVAQSDGPANPVLVSKMAASVRTLAKIIQEGVEALKVSSSEYNMTSLRESITTVGEAYHDILVTSHLAAGKPIHDENMMTIMQRAAHLASLLSLFLKTLRSLQETC